MTALLLYLLFNPSESFRSGELLVGNVWQTMTSCNSSFQCCDHIMIMWEHTLLHHGTAANTKCTVLRRLLRYIVQFQSRCLVEARLCYATCCNPFTQLFAFVGKKQCQLFWFPRENTSLYSNPEAGIRVGSLRGRCCYMVQSAF